jgi:hypothetical protein
VLAAPAAPAAGGSAAAAAFEPSAEGMAMIASMGFNDKQAIRALKATVSFLCAVAAADH